MKKNLILLCVCCLSYGDTKTESEDPLIIFEDSGILMNEHTGFSTINQRAKSVLGFQICTENEPCSKCPTESCNTAQNSQDISVALGRLSKSSTSRLGRVAITIKHLILSIRDIFTKKNEIISRQKLTKEISNTFTTFEQIITNQTESIGVISQGIMKIIRLISSDLQTITETRKVEIKNAAVCELGNHVIALLDATAGLLKITSGVSGLVTENLCQGMYSMPLVTSCILIFIAETLPAVAAQVNKVGFINDTASIILPRFCTALDQYVLVVQTLAECDVIQSLKENLPQVTASLFTAATTLTDNIKSIIGYVKKHPVPMLLVTVVESFTDCVKGSKHLKKDEAIITEAIYSFYDICIALQAARLGCYCIEGFMGNVDALIRKVLQYVDILFFIIVNIEDDIFSCSNKLLMFLTTLNFAISKVTNSIDELIQSILSLGDVTDGSSSLISVFEAVLDVAGSAIEIVAYMFTPLKLGSHLCNLTEVINGIMHEAKSRIDGAKNALIEKLSSDGDNTCFTDIYKEASVIISSYNSFKYDIADVICRLHHSKENDSVDDTQIAQVDYFTGKLKSSAEHFSSDSIGSALAILLYEVVDEVYDVLIQLASLTLEKWEVLKIVSFLMSNFYYGIMTLTSVLNCCNGGNSVF